MGFGQQFKDGNLGIGTSAAGDVLVVSTAGNVGIGSAAPLTKLDVAGTITATAFSGDGSGLSGTGDNLGNHTPTQNIQLGNYYLSGDGGNEGVFVNSTGNVGIGSTSPALSHYGEDIRSKKGRGEPFRQIRGHRLRASNLRWFLSQAISA